MSSFFPTLNDRKVKMNLRNLFSVFSILILTACDNTPLVRESLLCVEESDTTI